MEIFNQIMLDLETMGDRSNSAIISIGAVPFNLKTGEYGKKNLQFYKKIDLQSSLDVGLNIQANTIYWWMQQNQDARKEICKPAESICSVLSDFWFYIKSFGDDLEIWSNGIRFDIGLLQDAYYACGYNKMCWDFRNERDVRTLASLAPNIKNNHNITGTSHNPIDDCINQIIYSNAIYNKIIIT